MERQNTGIFHKLHPENEKNTSKSKIRLGILGRPRGTGDGRHEDVICYNPVLFSSTVER
jgi:hypothetical protein